MSAGEPRASTLSDATLVGYLQHAQTNGLFHNDTIARIVRSHINTNAKLQQERARVAELTSQLNSAHRRISAGMSALGPGN